MLKNVLLTLLIGFGMLSLTACTDGKDGAAGKCDSAKTVKTKCDAGKCDTDKKTETKPEGKCNQ